MIEIILKTKFEKLPDLPKSEINIDKINKNYIIACAALSGVPKRYIGVVDEYLEWQQKQDENEWKRQININIG